MCLCTEKHTYAAEVWHLPQPASDLEMSDTF